jgi:hypothetical protein
MVWALVKAVDPSNLSEVQANPGLSLFFSCVSGYVSVSVSLCLSLCLCVSVSLCLCVSVTLCVSLEFTFFFFFLALNSIERPQCLGAR